MKNNIIRKFLSLGVHLKIVPWDYDFTNEEYDGVHQVYCKMCLLYIFLSSKFQPIILKPQLYIFRFISK